MLVVRQLLTALWLFPCSGLAGDILASRVTHDAGVYQLSLTVRIDASMVVVYRLITDFDNLGAINPTIEESRVIALTDTGRQRVRSVINACILVFCKRMVLIQDVALLDSQTIEAVMLPQGSDFRDGYARWELTTSGVATEMVFTQTLEPDFWVPPVIGPWLIKRKLMHEVTETVKHIELIANGQPVRG